MTAHQRQQAARERRRTRQLEEARALLALGGNLIERQGVAAALRVFDEGVRKLRAALRNEQRLTGRPL